MTLVLVVALTVAAAFHSLGNYSKKNGCVLNAAALHPCVSAHATPTPTPKGGDANERLHMRILVDALPSPLPAHVTAAPAAARNGATPTTLRATPTPPATPSPSPIAVAP